MYKIPQIIYCQTQFIVCCLNLPVVYPLVFLSLDSHQTNFGGNVSSVTILNNDLKYHKIGYNGNLGNKEVKFKTSF